jgi:hypothetical protein
MTEKTDNLVLEQLRAMRAQNDRILDELRNLQTAFIASRHHGRAVEITQDKHQDELVSLQLRVDRIERRLELADK